MWAFLIRPDWGMRAPLASVDQSILKANMDTTKLNREMGKVKVALMANPQVVFFSTLVLSLKSVWDENHKTAYTNGTVIGFNPTFFLSLTKDERLFVLVHEALHVIWKHILPDRFRNRVHGVWVAACDFVINATLIQYGFKMPNSGLYDPRFAGMSAEQVYAILIKENYQPPPDMWSDLKAPDQDIPELEREIENITVRAATVAKMAAQGVGNIPDSIQRLLQDIVSPKLPWTTILHRWLNARVRNGYDFTKPNKRYFPNAYLPSRNSKGLKDMTVFIDVSSSVADYQFNIMISELAGVFKRFKPKITLVTFNTAITGVHKIKSVNDLRTVKFKGYGGTSCECVFDYIDKHKVDAALIFTDGDFHWTRDTLDCPVVWLINDNDDFKPKFGKAIHYETN